MRRFAFFVTVLAAALLPTAAFAQVNFDPSRIPDQFRLEKETEAAPAMPVAPPVQSTAPLPDAPRFVVTQIQITGMSVLDDDKVAALVNGYINQSVTLNDMQDLANKLTALYRSEGYVLSQVIIPPQRVENGVIQLAALEGQITAITFTGDTDLWLQASAAALMNEQPLKINTLQRWLLLANDAPGLTVTGNLAPDPTAPLGSQLVVDVKRDDVSVIAGFDNRGSKYIGPWQIYSGLQWNGAFLRGDTIALRGYTSHPDGQLKYVQVQQSMPLGTNGLRLETTADIVRSKPGDNLKTLEAEGKTDAVSFALTYPVIRSLVQNLVIGVTAEMNNNRTSILDEPKLAPSVNDRTRVLSFVGSYNRVHENQSASNARVTVSRGLDVLHSSQGNVTNPSRLGAEAEFWRMVAEVDHRLPMSFIKQGSTLLLATQAQTSFGDSLLAGEQMAAGGGSFGRGFDPAIISGDQGIMGKVELAVPFDLSPVPYMHNTEVYTFADAAYMEDENTAAGIEPHRQLFSAGLGFRVAPTPNIAAYVEGAKQLPMSILSNGDRPDGYRVTTGIIARF